MSYAEFVATSSTKLLFHMNGNSNDSSGGGHNGTDTSMSYTYAAGKMGQGAVFNGSTSKITGTFTQPTSAYTLSCWLTFSGSVADTNYRIFDSQESGTPNTGIVVAYNPSLGGTTKNLRVYHNNGSWSSSSDLGSLIGSTKRNVIITWDGTTHSFYVDGKLISTNSYSDTVTNFGNFDIGHGRATATFWSGNMDEFILENRVWSAKESRKYFSQFKGIFLPAML